MKEFFTIKVFSLLTAIFIFPVLCSGEEQKSETKSLPPSFIDPVTNMEFILVKGGCFEMGDSFGEGDNDEPLHHVCLDDYYIGKYEVTNSQFKKFVDATGYRTTAEVKGTGWGLGQNGPGRWEERSGLAWLHPIWPADSIENKMMHPVVQVSWHDAKEFARWLSVQNSRLFRLPTEAEWEYAARSGGKPYRYSWGSSDPSGNVADLSFRRIFQKTEIFEKYNDKFAYTAPVGSFRPNELGIYDMTGNVSEWCEDWYDENYYNESTEWNPTGPERGEKKVSRGGAWNNVPRIVRISNRDHAEPGSRYFNVGFRLAVPVR